MQKKITIPDMTFAQLSRLREQMQASIVEEYFSKKTKYLTLDQRMSMMKDIQTMAVLLGFTSSLTMSISDNNKLEGNIFIHYDQINENSFFRMFADDHFNVGISALDFIEKNLWKNHDERKRKARLNL